MKIIGLLLVHILCLYFLRLLWKDKNEALKRGRLFTKMGHVSRRTTPRLFYFSVWVDFLILLILYAGFIAYSIFLIL